ncbi:hypothetical protein CIPAW_07G008600 [Carya illinoinensis]|uniref:Zinc finger PHD-type domain-containing protein n=1 Tax=Carya illinoinensis TaxID=32201 RepID=A0A8T1Q0B6_CARIL|nr:hypothetical protein CIPAW_07G008600 [Carya illinoinensis]
MEIQHFSHHHPLHTLVLLNKVGVDRCKICFLILATDSDDYYGCKECSFYVHKSCAEYPHELQHHSHPKHLLLLKLHRYERCANCNFKQFNFKYKCPHCHEFYLCPKCAFLPLTEKSETHDHPLTLMQKLLPFKCDGFACNACGNKIENAFYFCATCSFVAHLDCAFLPSTVKVIRHKHPLNLIYSLPADQSKRRVCQLCAKTVDMNYWVYCCSSQDFVAHLHCATSNKEKDETFVPKHEEDDLFPYIVNKTKRGGDGTEIHTEIKHFSHEHDLKLTDGLGIDKKCDGCIRPIFPPFYSCVQCGFFLHKSCVELKSELQHSLHRHPLKLLLREKSLNFQCDACRLQCNGFTYCCHKCNFDLDIQCSLIPDILTHPSHEQHQLILASLSKDRICSVCGSSGRCNFSCVDCDFTLDFKCLTQPHMMNYEKHDHPFPLCYTSEDDSGEYYCDICEEKRDPKCWFYYCADCSYPAHLECIRGKHPNLKFGRTFKYDIHQHPLALVQKTFAQCSECGGVGEEDLAYECAECNFIVHPFCTE